MNTVMDKKPVKQMEDATPIMELTPTSPNAVVPAPQLAGPMGAALQALRAGMSIADMRGLLDLQKDWEANEARKAYVADMAAFKLNPPEIFKTKAVGYDHKDGGGSTAYMHATLGDVCEKIVEGLAQHGFSHRWDTLQPAGGQIFVTCTLTHRLGHSETTTLNSSADQSGKKNNIQAMASTVSYLQRYTLLGASGLATKDMPDDDGQLGGGGVGGEKAPVGEVLQSWIDLAKAATTLVELNQTRKDGGTAFGSVYDTASWDTFKAVVESRRVELVAKAPKP